MDTNPQSNFGYLTQEIIERLKEPMELERVKLRKAPGGGIVPYMSGEDAIDTANRIFNFAWSSQVGEIKYLRTDDRVEMKWNPDAQRREVTGAGKRTGIYYVIVSVTACHITKSDVGRCICEGNSAEAHDMAIAGAVTDGLKRALRQFGDQFGNCLYDKDSEVFKEALQGVEPAWQKPEIVPAKPSKPTVKANMGRPVEQLLKEVNQAQAIESDT